MGLPTDAQLQVIADYNNNIQIDQKTIDENTAAIGGYQKEINAAQSTIEIDNLNLSNPNLDPKAIPGIQSNIQEAQSSIDENQSYIVGATTAITAAQSNMSLQKQGLADLQSQFTGISAPAAVNSLTDPQLAIPDNTIATSAIQTAPALVPKSFTGYQTQPIPTPTSTPTNVASPATSSIKSAVQNARRQQNRTAQWNLNAVNSDWRVKLSLAQGADYLYKSGNAGILAPLQPTNGVIFPYTPKIDTAYKAQYSPYELTHSNYKGYFYQSSSMDTISISALFTAQNTADANYLLAVIHFFRSATKMFYGQDAQRGSPPPLVFLSGLGDYQFNNHSCLITQFTYSLPDDVDYIRAQYSNQSGHGGTEQSNKYAIPIGGADVSKMRLMSTGQDIAAGAMPSNQFAQASSNPGQGAPTYVPTKMTVTISLLPVNTRQQVSQQFSLADYASGSLLKGGFW